MGLTSHYVPSDEAQTHWQNRRLPDLADIMKAWRIWGDVMFNIPPLDVLREMHEQSAQHGILPLSGMYCWTFEAAPTQNSAYRLAHAPVGNGDDKVEVDYVMQVRLIGRSHLLENVKIVGTHSDNGVELQATERIRFGMRSKLAIYRVLVRPGELAVPYEVVREVWL